MEDRLLITPEDIKTYRPTAELDIERVNPHILENQKVFLKPLLNGVLYYDFIKNFDNTSASYNKYRELLNGKEWTRTGNTDPEYFDGVKPMLVYYTLVSLCEENPINITRFGLVTKVSANSKDVDPKVLTNAINKLKSVAQSFERQVTDFIEANRTTYASYDKQSQTAGNRTSFNFTKL